MPPPRSRDDGQAILEYLIVILPTLLIILGILQVGLMFNARSVMQLAAFNAARAAVVARGASPASPVSIDEMKKRAQLAAFVTLLPVISGISGAPRDGAAENVVRLSGAHPDDNPGLFLESLRNLGSQQPQLLLQEFRAINVSIVRPDASDPTDSGAEVKPGETIRFDDPARSRENLIKVVVTWDYPLVIPFVNRVMATTGKRSSLRVPMRSTSIMRMQWNWGPGEA